MSSYEKGRPTRRSSEGQPPGTPSGDADAAGGWLPLLTFTFDNPETGIQDRNSTTRIRQDNRMTTYQEEAQNHPVHPAILSKSDL